MKNKKWTATTPEGVTSWVVQAVHGGEGLIVRLRHGMRVRVAGGSGLDSDKVGRLTSDNPRNEPGYFPAHWKAKRWAVIVTDTGERVVMLRNRLIPED